MGKRLRKRRQIATNPSPPASPGSPEPMEGSSSNSEQQRATSPMIAGEPSSPPKNSGSAILKKADRPVFTLKQMTMICEKTCQERTDQVREEYDRILQQKLSEHDAFVK